MDFSLSPEQLDIRERARRFVREECDPIEADWPLSDYDADPALVARLREKFTEYGFRGVAIPTDAGGRGAGTLAKCILFEELRSSWVTYGQTVVWSAFLDPHPVLYQSPEWMREKYLYPILEGREQYHICISEPDAGSDVAAITTRAERVGDHYVLNGVKRWSPDPFHPFTKPEYLLVYAVTSPGMGYKGISTFLVDFPSEGITVGEIKQTAAPGTFLGRVCDLHFNNVKIPAKNILGEENSGFRYVQDQLNRNRTVIGAGCVGGAQKALKIATARAKERVTFGAPLAERQHIQFMLADMVTEIEIGRLLTYKAGWKIDQGEDARVEAAMAKSYCVKMASSVYDRAMQIVGGIGMLEESRLPTTYYQHRIAHLAEGSIEMMKQTIAKSLLTGWG